MSYNIFAYLKFEYQNEKKSDLVTNLKSLLSSFWYMMFAIFLSSMLILIPLDGFIKSVLKLPSILESLNQVNKHNANLSFLTVVLVGPFAEELIFRFFLNFKKINLGISLFFISFFVLGSRFNYEALFLKSTLINAIISILFSITIYLTIIKKYEFTIKYKIVITLFSIVIFGLVHITNFSDINYKLIPFYPFFVLPQIIMGYFITNLRLRKGFIWGFLLHALINLIFYVTN
ncbi:MAG: CPBP family glutamic-type intramembrane protease [Fusobacteriaceae bacterium]